MVEALKGLKEIISVKEWKDYVEEKKASFAMEEKKDYKGGDRRWHGKGKKQPSPEKPSPPKPKTKEEERPPQVALPVPAPPPRPTPPASQGYQMQYGNGQAYNPYYVQPSAPQGYSFSYYYGSYPRPPY